jgi:adenylate kinase
MLNIALFGPPGSGKGTQSELLLEKYKLEHISTGDILRDQIARQTDLGLQAKLLIDKGQLVPDELIVQLLEARMTEKADANGFLFDGFPRNNSQASILENLLLKLNTSLTCMISLEVDQNELMRRLLERAKVQGRSDDTEEVISARFKEYESKTLPVIAFYKDRGIYIPVKGVGTIKEIFESIVKVIDSVIQ